MGLRKVDEELGRSHAVSNTNVYDSDTAGKEKSKEKIVRKKEKNKKQPMTTTWELQLMQCDSFLLHYLFIVITLDIDSFSVSP